MTEEFLQFIWKLKLFERKNLFSTQGDKIDIVDVGRLNTNAGPDFINAKVKINDLLWAGNIEIHLKSSLWYQHKHHEDRAYDNVILHVVIDDDAEVIMADDRYLPCIIINFDRSLLLNYQSLMNSHKWIPCWDEISGVEQFFVKSWLDRMLLERLERKAENIKMLLQKNKFSWEEGFYQILARYFGMNVNADPFQQLAQSLPLKILARQKNSLIQIEALLFGQAGMLFGNECQDEYFIKLKREYQFLADKYQLTAMPNYRWKWLRLRPANFPSIRIALLAALIYQSSSLFSRIKSVKAFDELFLLFDVEVSDYWKNHYRFGVESKNRKKKLGKNSVQILIINAVVPILFCYGDMNQNTDQKERAMSFLNHLSAENNSIIQKWKDSGVAVQSAWQSQALLQLKSNYCESFKCLQCEFGNRIIRMKNYERANK